MTGRTHTFTAVATSLVLASFIQEPKQKITFVLCSCITSRLADIDLSLKIRHRGFTHSFVGFLVFSLIIIPLGVNSFTMGLIWGYLSHIIADSFTVYGTYPFYPCKRIKLRLAKLRTGNIFHETVFCFVVGFMAFTWYYVKMKLK